MNQSECEQTADGVIMTDAEAIVQRQLDAYNARDVDAWLETYAEDAQQFEHPDKLLASGHTQLRARIAARFQEANLHARLLKRIVLGETIIDYEEVSRMFPEGAGKMELAAIYDVKGGRIARACFITGRKTLDKE